MPFADPQDLEALPTQLEIAGTIILERAGPSVVAVAVDLDDKHRVAPEEVHLMSADQDVVLGLREAGTAAEAQEEQLEIAARATKANLQAGRQPERVRLPDRAT